MYLSNLNYAKVYICEPKIELRVLPTRGIAGTQFDLESNIRTSGTILTVIAQIQREGSETSETLILNYDNYDEYNYQYRFKKQWDSTGKSEGLYYVTLYIYKLDGNVITKQDISSFEILSIPDIRVDVFPRQGIPGTVFDIEMEVLGEVEIGFNRVISHIQKLGAETTEPIDLIKNDEGEYIGSWNSDGKERGFYYITIDLIVPPLVRLQNIQWFVVDGQPSCQHIAGEGSTLTYVIIPCLFSYEEKGQFESYAHQVAESISEIEPLNGCPQMYSVSMVSDFSMPLFDDNANDCRDFSSDIMRIASTCPLGSAHVVIVVAHNSGEASGGGGIAVIGSGTPPCCPGDNWDFAVKFTALHEAGHVLGFSHTCNGGSVNPSPPGTEMINCNYRGGESEDQPCPGWERYQAYVKPGDPPFGCYQGCNGYVNWYRPWYTNDNIMCRDDDLSNGFTPVERGIIVETFGCSI